MYEHIHFKSVCLFPKEIRRGFQIPLDFRYTLPEAILRVVGIKPMSSTRTAIALKPLSHFSIIRHTDFTKTLMH